MSKKLKPKLKWEDHIYDTYKYSKCDPSLFFVLRVYQNLETMNDNEFKYTINNIEFCEVFESMVDAKLAAESKLSEIIQNIRMKLREHDVY